MEKTKKPIANLVAYQFSKFHEDWFPMYKNIVTALIDMGFEVRASPRMEAPQKFWKLLGDDFKVGIKDSKDDVYIYNHTWPEEVASLGFFKGKHSIFIKPTGPTNKHYSIDPLGYSSRITITYDKPTFENIDYKQYWDNEVSKIRNEKLNKWTNEYQFQENNEAIPDNHILFIGQMPGDTSVNQFSFNSHMNDIEKLVNNLDSKDPVVIKLHPFLKKRASKEYWKEIDEKIKYWESIGHIVISDFVDIHTILPKTKLAIIENSTAGIECMLYDIPMITFGCPEYRWVTKELRHLVNLNKYKNDLSWFSKELNRKFLVWYIRDYLCYDIESTKKRLKEILH